MEETLFPGKEVPATFMKAEGKKRTLVSGTGHKFIIREDTGEVLSCMTDEYKVVDNKSVVNKVEKVLKGSGAEYQKLEHFPMVQKLFGNGIFLKPKLRLKRVI